ncbi:MAG: tetratricopeptide repeat protein [Arcobacter sp.]|nr:tetratricopeptide repeat protein [Arcobacter sp.]
MQKNTFRLFVSSTFSDFVGEREVLQTQVFPKVEKYASQKGASFQAIDLRWGVSAEAQVDQQTLDLCLREVKTCKSKPYPNFLILSGDRYGWVPLPFMIEQKEFKSILENINDKEDEDLLKDWYKLDENQIPSSYRLQERKDKYIDPNIWEKEEEKLRIILQTNIKKVLDKNDNEYQKYFTSATKAESIKGIIKDKNLKSNSIFSFFRDIYEDTLIENSDFYINKDDNKKAKEFRKELIKYLKKENYYAKTKQLDKNNLDTSYLEKFAQKVEIFLKEQIDKHLFNTKDITPLEKEKQEQKLHKENKLKNFIEIEDSLKKINSYISDEKKDYPLIIYGKSGMGKSSLIAKSVEQREKKEQVIYRFVGASSQSTDVRELLVSIFNELKIDINELEKNQRQHLEFNTEKIEEKEERQHLEQKEDILSKKFLPLVKKELSLLKDRNISIFIDALDQCILKDKEILTLWIPEKLNKNIKLIISVLNDENHQEDSAVYENLKKHLPKNNFYPIPKFSDEIKLLKNLLKKENRRITQDQKEYFLKQYKKAQTPFYISIASYEMKYWKSYQEANEYDLQDSNKNIVREFIENLNKFYHHNKYFIQKSLCYILTSKYGLSEIELITLFNQDKELIKQIKKEELNGNKIKKIPLVHWSRFHTALSPFLKSSLKDGQEVFYFFHREFLDAIKEVYKLELEKEHRSLLRCIQSIIKDENMSKEDFNSNRWGKLYAIVLVEYKKFLNGEVYINDDIDEFISFIPSLNDEWIEEWLIYLNENWDYNHKHNYADEAIAFIEVKKEVSNILYTQNPLKWAKNYTISLNNLAISYKDIGKTDETINLEKEAFDISKNLYMQDPNRWAEYYITPLNNLATSYSNIEKISEAINLQKEALEILKSLYTKNPDRWAENYTKSLIDLSTSYGKIENIIEAITLQKEALEILKSLYTKNPDRWAENYIIPLNKLATSYYNIGKLNEAINLFKFALDILKKLYTQNQKKWAEKYTTSLNNLATSYKNIGKTNEAKILEKEASDILEKLYSQNPDRWAEAYIISLNNLATSYYMEKTSESTDLFKKAYEISKNHLGEEHPNTQRYLTNYNVIKKTFETKNEENTFSTILKLAKVGAISKNETTINIKHFLNALCFVDLEENARDIIKKIFEKIIDFDIDTLPKQERAKLFIHLSDEKEDIPYDESIEYIVDDLKEIFGNEPICTLR